MHDTVAPEFFLEYPGGKILFLSGSPNLHLALAALRVLGFAIELADRDFQQIQSIGPFRMLADVQGMGVFYPGKHLSIPIAMFLPRLYGFAAGKVSLGFLFLFDKPIPEVRGFYPRSGLEFVRSEASSLFRQSVDLEVDKITSQAVDKFTLLLREFTSKQIEDFLKKMISPTPQLYNPVSPKQQPLFTRDNIFLSLTPVFPQDHASMYWACPPGMEKENWGAFFSSHPLSLRGTRRC